MPNTNVLMQTGSGSALNASASAQDIIRYTVPGRTLGSNKRLRIVIDGQMTTAVSLLPTLTITLVFGSQSYTVVLGLTLLTSLSSAPWQLVAHIIANSTTSQFSTAVAFENISVLNTTTPRMAQGSFTQTITGDVDIAVTVTFSGVSVGTSIVRKAAIVEVVG